MLFKVLYFDVLNILLAIFRQAMHLIISPIKAEWHSLKVHKQLSLI